MRIFTESFTCFSLGINIVVKYLDKSASNIGFFYIFLGGPLFYTLFLSGYDFYAH